MFYLKFIANGHQTKGGWLQLLGTSTYKVWSGLAFESVCLKHSRQMKAALGIEGMSTQESTWRSAGLKQNNSEGAQIDLVIDRADGCINVCEIKFSSRVFEITKSYARELDRKLEVFRARTATSKTLFLTLITTHGLKKNTYSSGLVQAEMVLEQLFT